MLKMELTDETVQALPYAEAGARISFQDASVENLMLTVGESNKVFFYLANVSDGSWAWPLGSFNTIRTQKAREIARRLQQALLFDTNSLSNAAPCEIGIGYQIPTFAEVVQTYIAQLPNRRHNRGAERDAKFLLHYLVDTNVNSWAAKAITEVSEEDILTLIGSLRDRPALANCCLRKVRTFYVWAMQPPQRHYFRLTSNPAANLLPRFVAPYRSRPNIFFDEELHAYLVAVEALTPPYRALAEALALTGHCLSDLATMTWAELDLSANTWTPMRHKIFPSSTIPISDTLSTLLMKFKTDSTTSVGEFVFSTTKGYSPVSRFAEMKSSLDCHMAEILGQPLEWKWTDLRRSVRSMLLHADLSQTQAAYAFGFASPWTKDQRKHALFWRSPNKAVRAALNRHAKTLARIRQQ